MFNKGVRTSNGEGVSDEIFTEQVKCDITKKELEKVKKELEECRSGKNKPGVLQKLKEAGKSLKRSLSMSQNGGKRKKTKRRLRRK